MNNTKYDIVIIGSGLGALVSGYILSKEKYKVCILEKNTQIGGTLQCFKRDGCVFDTGMHYIGSLDKGQILHRIFKYFNLLDKINVKKMDEDGFDIFNINGVEYKYAMGYNKFTKTLISYFPEEEHAIKKYTKKIREVANSLDLYNLRETSMNEMINVDYVKVNAWDFIKSLTKNERLQNVLAGLNSLYAGKPESTPLYVHALINNFYIESAYRLIDGSAQIADLLAEGIINNGGVVLKKKKVEKFIFDNKSLIAVELSDKQKYYADYFISNIHPAVTMDMIEPGKIRKAYKNRLKSLENTISSFSLYIILKENCFKYINANYYYYKNDSVWGVANYNEDTWPDGYMLFTSPSSKSDKYAKCITVITYMKFEEMKKWENTWIEKRGDDYKKMKQQKAEKLLDLVEKKFPDIRKYIKLYYTATPLTYRDYIGTYDGSMYGIVRNCNNPMQSYIFPRTKIPNLLLTGQNINLHGILGVTIGAILTCGELIGVNNLINKINNA
ncbi:MAG: NAD(P)/FAD-dependent oxidoreductase [Bacteroidales bacterium]|nr:NAD(P)/FAD-dependent oxidoreductase [Bacteroidales bacterium]